jgi:hemoglobin/transferrin/lactoferrin receptor protein
LHAGLSVAFCTADLAWFFRVIRLFGRCLNKKIGMQNMDLVCNPVLINFVSHRNLDSVRISLLLFSLVPVLLAQGAVPQEIPKLIAPKVAAPVVLDPDPSAQDPALSSAQAKPLIVTALRVEESVFAAPYAIDLVQSAEVTERGYRTLPQALRYIPSVMVQETAPGQGSPYIRGFTGYSNLLLIDGVRLNNSAFRSGPNQYWSTVDLLSVDHIEVLKGPSGAQYGSDAVGGTVQAFTRSPTMPVGFGSKFGGSTYLRYASAEDTFFGRGEVSVGHGWENGTATGVLIGGDLQYYGDVEGGSSTGRQQETGYEQDDFDVKVEHSLGKNERLVLLHQQVAQIDVPRTHSTIYGRSYAGTTVGTDLRRNFDQNRNLSYLQYHATKRGGAIDGIHANVSWQEQTEDEDRINATNVATQQGFDVGTLGAFLQVESEVGDLGRLVYGADYYRDTVHSYGRNLNTGVISIQGPVADDASYELLGAFVQDTLALGDRTELTLGGRYTYAAADADKVRDPSTGSQIAINDEWQSLTGNARLRVDLLANQWNVYSGVSQGFRAPNLSDLTSSGIARSGEIEIPTIGLSPEHYLGYEIGTKVLLPTASLQLAWFYTQISDQIQRYPTGTLTPTGSAIVTKANIGDGYIQGFEAQGDVDLIEHLKAFGLASYQYGRVTNYEAAGSSLTEEYTTRLMPLSSMVGLRVDLPDSTWHGEVLVANVADADRLSYGDRRDTQRIPPNGTPGYTIASIHAGCAMSDRASLDFGIDNITDADYRVHGSGSNSPGRSYWLGMKVTF